MANTSPRSGSGGLLITIIVLLAFAIGVGAYAFSLRSDIVEIERRLVAETSSTGSPLGSCSIALEKARRDITFLENDVEDAEDDRRTAEKNESTCLQQLLVPPPSTDTTEDDSSDE